MELHDKFDIVRPPGLGQHYLCGILKRTLTWKVTSFVEGLGSVALEERSCPAHKITQLKIRTESEGLASVEPISPRDWKWIDFAVDVLKPELDTTKEVGGENYITLSIVVPVAILLLAYCKQMLSETGLAKEEKTSLWYCMQR